LRIANALNVSSTDWQNVHRVIGRPKGRGRGAGNRSGCLRGVGGEPTVHRFFLLIPTRRRTVVFYENAGRPILPCPQITTPYVRNFVRRLARASRSAFTGTVDRRFRYSAKINPRS
jgi:hypothetical protein